MAREPKKQIYNDVWFFYKQFLNGDGSDSYWETVNREGQVIITRHKGDPFVRGLISTVIMELQRGINGNQKN